MSLGRTLSDIFAGIAPSSVPMFVLMQVPGGVLAAGAVVVHYADTAEVADGITPMQDTLDPAGRTQP